MDVFELLQTVKTNQDAFERAKRRYQDRLAPEFTPFDFIEPDEMRLSSILAWLLRSREAIHGQGMREATHGQGGRFLHLFVARLFRDLPGSAWPLEACEHAEAKIEFTVRGGRIDILVNSGNRTLVLENKAGAGDQRDQLNCYAAYLDSLKQADTRLIYLTPDGSDPSKESIDEQQRICRIKDGQLHLWSYREHILEWLAECRSVCRADRVAIFIDEFARYIRKRFEGVSDMTMQNQLVQDVTRSAETVEPAMQVIQVADAVRAKLISTLHDQLETAMAAHEGWSLSDWNMPAYERFAGFGIRFSAQSRYLFAIEFQNTIFTGLIYGVSTPDKPSNDGNAPAAIAADIGPGNQNEGWTWYRSASLEEPVFRVEPRWGSTVTPWVAIADGTMSGLIIRTASHFRDAMARCGLL